MLPGCVSLDLGSSDGTSRRLRGLSTGTCIQNGAGVWSCAYNTTAWGPCSSVSTAFWLARCRPPFFNVFQLGRAGVRPRCPSPSRVLHKQRHRRVRVYAGLRGDGAASRGNTVMCGRWHGGRPFLWLTGRLVCRPNRFRQRVLLPLHVPRQLHLPTFCYPSSCVPGGRWGLLFLLQLVWLMAQS